MIGRRATALGAVAVLGIGFAAWTWPRASTRSYGIPKDDPDTLAYVQAVAARDVVMGAYVLWAAIADDRPAMESGLLACALAPAADLLLAYERRGAIPQLVTHGAGVIGVLVAWALVRAGL